MMEDVRQNYQDYIKDPEKGIDGDNGNKGTNNNGNGNGNSDRIISKLETVNLNDLSVRKGNPNEMTWEQLQSLEYSIDTMGMVQYIVVDQNNVIVDGAQRYAALRNMGVEKTDVVRVNIRNENDLKLLSQVLNKLRGKHDLEKDVPEMEALLDYDPDELDKLLSFGDVELDKLRQQMIEEEEQEQLQKLREDQGQQQQQKGTPTGETDEDLESLPIPEDIIEPVTKLGDVWKLGKHTLVCGDSHNQEINEKVDLLIMDSPYNINTTSWDNIDNYFPRLKEWILKFKSLLKETGSFYFFHNQIPFITQLMPWIEKNTDLVFHEFIVWNKFFEGCDNYEYLKGFNEPKGLRNYQKFAEYILFYTFQDETGLTKIMHDMGNFQPLRQYFKRFQEAIGMNKSQIMDTIGQQADHCFRWDSSQWDLPTPETYDKLIGLVKDPTFHIKNYEESRQEYEKLRQEYEKQRYVFNNQKTHSSVWNYSFVNKTENDLDHPTPKPVPLIKTILEYSSNKNGVILDPFLGSGSTLIACEQTSRTCYGIEIDMRYCDISIERWERYTGNRAVRLSDGKKYSELKKENE